MYSLIVFFLFFATFANDLVILTEEEVNSMIQSRNPAPFHGLSNLF